MKLNIFVLDADYRKAAQMACDRHCVKMILESTQLLCTSILIHGGDAPYKKTHSRHPSTIFTAKTKQNWLWVRNYALALCEEYTYRYKKIHKCQAIIESLVPTVIPDGSLTSFPQAMPDAFKRKDVVEAYRTYYREGKGYMNKGRGPQWLKAPERKPSWF